MEPAQQLTPTVQVQGSMVGCTAPRLHRDIMNPPILLTSAAFTFRIVLRNRMYQAFYVSQVVFFNLDPVYIHDKITLCQSGHCRMPELFTIVDHNRSLTR